jgi:uncharacterized membrane protein
LLFVVGGGDAQSNTLKSYYRMAAVFATFALTSFVHSVGIVLEAGGFLSTRVAEFWRLAAQVSFGAFFIIGGLAHFDPKLTTRLYIPMMPPFIPSRYRAAVNTAAGIAELSVGLASLGSAVMASKSGAAGSAATALAVLVAVFPANVYVALSRAAQAATGQPQGFAYTRLLIQLTFCLWAAWPLIPSPRETFR